MADPSLMVYSLTPIVKILFMKASARLTSCHLANIMGLALSDHVHLPAKKPLCSNSRRGRRAEGRPSLFELLGSYHSARLCDVSDGKTSSTTRRVFISRSCSRRSIRSKTVPFLARPSDLDLKTAIGKKGEYVCQRPKLSHIIYINVATGRVSFEIP